MLHYSEDDVKKAADLREWLLKQISDKQEEVDRLRNLLLLIDSLLKQESLNPHLLLDVLKFIMLIPILAGGLLRFQLRMRVHE